MADNRIAYNTIEEVKTIIERSTSEINDTFRSMSNNIAEEYAASGGAALSGSAGAAIASAWAYLASKLVPPMKENLEVLTMQKLTNWGAEFGITEDQINQLFGKEM